MLHPSQFKVNQTWLAFKLNDVPIRTVQDGELDAIALMDAGSCFILGSVLVAARRGEPSTSEAVELLKQGQGHSGQLPKTLFIPTNESAQHLTLEAERQGITVVQVPEDQLLVFIGEAREGFREYSGMARS